MTFDELKDGSFFCRVIGGIGASIGVCALTKIDSSRFCESSRSDTIVTGKQIGRAHV